MSEKYDGEAFSKPIIVESKFRSANVKQEANNYSELVEAILDIMQHDHESEIASGYIKDETPFDREVSRPFAEKDAKETIARHVAQANQDAKK